MQFAINWATVCFYKYFWCPIFGHKFVFKRLHKGEDYNYCYRCKQFIKQIKGGN